MRGQRFILVHVGRFVTGKGLNSAQTVRRAVDLSILTQRKGISELMSFVYCCWRAKHTVRTPTQSDDSIVPFEGAGLRFRARTSL